MMDIEIDANGVVIKMLENRIKQLEKIKDDLEKEIAQLKLKPNGNAVKDTNRPPKHLSKVHAAHLSKLKGYSWRYVAEANGACATNSLAVAFHEDEDEGPKLKRRTLDHIADHYAPYYVNKIGLPYVETVGVGVDSKVVTKERDEEMVAFLRSKEAMTVFANTHELLAVANMYNIRIHVFSYGGSKDGCCEVPPDPHMVALLGSASSQWVPEVALYHSYDSHYDLLVKRESRIALLGLLAGSADNADKVEAEECKGNSVDEWTTVNHKKNKSKHVDKSNHTNEEQLLVEMKMSEANVKDLDEEVVLVNAKKNGYRRTGPHGVPESASKEPVTHKCMVCRFEFESDGILEAHRKTHKTAITCKICSISFETKESIAEHVLNKHKVPKNLNEWTCDDCAFQANCASELMKHLKVTAHQPSKNVKDKRVLFEDYKQCYTCKMDFDGFYNLMNHRKSVHPSNKRCRNFLADGCSFKEECWYLHGEISSKPEDTFDNFKCDLCEKAYKGRTTFMRHKKLIHPQSVPYCEKFSVGKCSRGEKECWFDHRESTNLKVDEKALNPWYLDYSANNDNAREGSTVR